MLASQLCVFDDKTDLKWKWVKKTHSMVVLSELSSLFVKISICDALSLRNMFNDMMLAKWMSYLKVACVVKIKLF